MKLVTKNAMLLAVMVLAIVAVVPVYQKMQPLEEALKQYRGDTIVSLELAVTPKRAHAVVHGWTVDPGRCAPAEPSAQGVSEKNAKASAPNASQKQDPNPCKLKQEARDIVHWDWAFIAAHLILMLAIGVLLHGSNSDRSSDWAKPLLIILPYAAALADTVENLGIYLLLAIFDPNGPGLLFGATTPVVGLLASFKFLILFLFLVASFRCITRCMRRWSPISWPLPVHLSIPAL